MDAVVQFLRNFFCCIKDLSLLQDTFLWDANVTARYYDFPEPLNKTTPLEALISVLQFYVVITATKSGYILLVNSYGKFRRIERLMSVQNSVKTNANRMVNASLVKEARFALRSMLIGFLVLCIGISFIWLSANSWHITETDWIGGVDGLIHSLTINEICLLPLLFYMWKDGSEQLAKAKRMEVMASKLKTNSLNPSDIDLSSLEMLSGWVPFWDEGTHPLEKVDSSKEEKLMVSEKAKVQGILDDLFGKQTDAKNEKEEKIRLTRLQEKGDELKNAAIITRWEGYREFLYFVLNFIAFYGYLLGIICYYYQDEAKQPPIVARLLLGMDNATADWHGNFIGDLMWTIEPIVILGSPIYLRTFQKNDKKVKTD